MSKVGAIMSTALSRYVAVLLLWAPLRLSAQIVSESVDVGAFGRIRDEGLKRSQVLSIARHLTDVIGPRLTGSPGLQAAHTWTAATMRGWGLGDVATKPWGRFGRGWENLRYYGRVLTPFNQQLHGAPYAWTGSTPGLVRAPVLLIEAASVEDLRARYTGQLRGRFIVAPKRPLVVDGDTLGSSQDGASAVWRLPLDSLVGRRVLDRDSIAADSARGIERRRQIMAQVRPQRPVGRELDKMLTEEHAAGFLYASPQAYGLIEHFGLDNWPPEKQDSVVMVTVASEEYSNIVRNLRGGVPVEIELDVQNRFLTKDLDAYNTFGDIRGAERPGEYVMIGAHLDSWHGGTGASDNAAGVAVVMEAMRILRALDLHPRRTIRVALWSGEEQGERGSTEWLKSNPALKTQISAYLNVDYGTGRIRGIDIGDNKQAAGIFEQVLWPFRDLGVIAVRKVGLGGSDHDPFNAAGIPGFSFIQDPLDYWDRTHHLNADTFDHLVEDNLKQAAVVVAATAYHLAMRSELLPRQ